MSSHKKNYIYTVEAACATNRQEKAIRISLFNQTDNFSIVEVVFADRSLFEMGIEIKEELKFALYSGFKDSMAIVQKMACLDKDYQKFELNQEINFKLNSNNTFDIMRDFQESKDTKNGENP